MNKLNFIKRCLLRVIFSFAFPVSLCFVSEMAVLFGTERPNVQTFYFSNVFVTRKAF